jgi:hypothetical protein
VRHGRRAAARGKAHLAHLVLGHEGDVLPELAQGSGEKRQKGRKLADPVPLRMPWGRRPEAEDPGHGRGHRIAPALQLGAGADGAAELDRQEARREIAQALPLPLQGLDPGVDLVGGREGQRLLHPRMRHQGRRALPRLQGREGRQ